MQEQKQILIAGCGYVGNALGQRLVAEGHRVWGLRRRTEGLHPGLRPFVADLADPSSLRALPLPLDVVFYTAAAGGRDESSYRRAYVDGVRNLLDALRASSQQTVRIFFTSSTSVYAQEDGEWVDEESPTLPTTFSGKLLLEGERLLAESEFASVIVRLAGIYGPGRTRLLESVRQGTATIHPEKISFSNRIHRDDCAGVLHHLMSLDAPRARYVGVDCAPVAQKEVLTWLAQRLGAAPPSVEVKVPSGRSPSNKRCRNQRLIESGYSFAFPTYQEGYEAVISEIERGSGF